MSKYKEGVIYFNADLYEALKLNVPEGEELKIEDIPDKIRIPVTRSGEFEHPWYGDLEFNREYLDKILNNFNNKVYPQKICGNIDHMSQMGAYAWVEDDDALVIESKSFTSPDGLTLIRDYLFADIELTPEGKKMVKDKKYRYISAEIHPDYTTREKFSVGGGKSVVRYGPTLTGFAFTNNPFIPNLMSIFNEDGKEVETDTEMHQFGEDGILGTFSTVRAKKVEEDQEETPESDLQVTTNDEVSIIKGEDMKFSELLAKLEGMSLEDQVKALEPSKHDFSDAETSAVAVLYSSKKAQLEAETNLGTVTAELEAKSDEIKELSEKVISAERNEFSTRADMLFSSLKNNGWTEAGIEAVKEIVESANSDSKMSFSDDTQMDILTIVKKVVDAIPLTERIDFSEITEVTPEGGQVEAQAKVTETEQVEETEGADKVPARILKFSERTGQPIDKIGKDLWPCIDENGVLDLDKEV